MESPVRDTVSEELPALMELETLVLPVLCKSLLNKESLLSYFLLAVVIVLCVLAPACGHLPEIW